MRQQSQGVLWAAAISASLAIHGALAASLAFLPASQPIEPERTSILMQTAPRAMVGAAMDVPSSVAPVASAQIAAVARESSLVQPTRAAAPAVAALESAGQVAAVQMPEIVAQSAARPQAAPAARGSDAGRVAVSGVADQVVNGTVAAGGEPRATAPVSDGGVVAESPASAPVARSEAQPEAIAAPRSAILSDTVASALRAAPTEGRVEVAHVVAENAASAILEMEAAIPVAPIVPEVGSSSMVVATERLVRAAQTQQQVVLGASNAHSQATVLAPSAPEQTVALVQPERPQLPPSNEPEATFSALLDLISVASEDRCFLALASDEDGVIQVNGYATGAGPVARLGQRIDKMIPSPVDLRDHLVSDEQCAALAFMRGLPAYPEQRLSVVPVAREIASGEQLSGRILNLSRRRLYLVVIDDDGRVQELRDLFLQDHGVVGFRTPLTLTDGPVGTAQLLLAIASDEALETLLLHDGVHAERYFEALGEEIARKGSAVDVGFTSFLVR